VPKTVSIDPPKSGDILFNVEEKVFPDYKASPGDKAYVFMHTVPFEGSVGFVNMLTATRLQRKGFELSFILFGPGVLMAATSRGYPAVGTEAFAGNLAYNRQLKTLMDEGAKVYACRFAMGALYGMREDDLIEGVKAISPHDVLDANIQAWKERAIVVTTWTR
jgi:uncharacterized repeat protein (TIGR04044 family)